MVNGCKTLDRIFAWKLKGHASHLQTCLPGLYIVLYKRFSLTAQLGLLRHMTLGI